MRRAPHSRRIAALAYDVACLARRDGVGAVAHSVAATTFARGDLHVLVKRLDAIEPIAFAPRLRLSELGRASLSELAEFNRRRCDTRASHRFAANLERRYHGFIAHDDGELAGYYWWLDATAEPHPHLGRLGIELAPRDVYGFDFLLDERHRGEGRAVDFLHQVETRLRERGYDRLWGYVDGANTAARWLYSMRGYEVAHTLPGRRRASMR
jgi:GNAT superfamily N-acetyltransferase